MHLTFRHNPEGPNRRVAEVELHFDGPLSAAPGLAGLKLTGLGVWRGADGSHFVTVPSHAYGAGGGRHFVDLLRSDDGTAEPIRRFKAWVLAAYEAQDGIESHTEG